MDDSVVEKITTGLNYHGDMFRQKVRDEMRKDGFISLINEELPIDRFKGVKIDLVMRQFINTTDVGQVIILVECKKVYKDKIKWLFLDRTDNAENQFLSSWQAHVDPIGYSVVRNPDIFDGMIVDQALDAYRLDTSAKEESKILNKDDLEEVINQIMLQFEAYVADYELYASALTEKQPFMILPIVVTNADLLLVKDYPISSIGIDQGKVNVENIKEKSVIVPYLLVKSFPNITKVGVTTQPVVFNTIKDHAKGKNKAVFFVNSSHLNEFINKFLRK